MAARNNKTLESIVQNGDELAILKGLRIKIANTIDDTNSGRDVAALSKQLREVSARISELEGEKFDAKNITPLDLILLKSDIQDRIRKNTAQGKEDEELDFFLETVDETLDAMREEGAENDEQEED